MSQRTSSPSDAWRAWLCSDCRQANASGSDGWCVPCRAKRGATSSVVNDALRRGLGQELWDRLWGPELERLGAEVEALCARVHEEARMGQASTCGGPCVEFARTSPRLTLHGETIRVLTSGDASALQRAILGSPCCVDPCCSAMCPRGTKGCIERHALPVPAPCDDPACRAPCGECWKRERVAATTPEQRTADASVACEDCAAMRRQVAVAVAEADAAEARAEQAEGIMLRKIDAVDVLHDTIEGLRGELAEARAAPLKAEP